MTSPAQQNGLAAKTLEYIQQKRDEKLDKEKDAAKQLEITAQYEPETWLTDAARRAKQLTFITHAAKYIHGDSKGSSVEAVSSAPLPSDGYISTHSVSEIHHDFVGNAAAKAVLLAGTERYLPPPHPALCHLISTHNSRHYSTRPLLRQNQIRS